MKAAGTHPEKREVFNARILDPNVLKTSFSSQEGILYMGQFVMPQMMHYCTSDNKENDSGFT